MGKGHGVQNFCHLVVAATAVGDDIHTRKS